MKYSENIPCLKNPILVCILGACATVLVGCQQTQLPPGAELTISPTDKTWTVADRRDANGNCFVDPEYYVDQPIVLSLRDGDGSPIADVDITVYVDLSENTSNAGYPMLALYDDRRGNNNGVIDDFELVSGQGDAIAVVKTDYYGGDRPLLLRMNLSCPFKGDVFAFSDGVVGSSQIAVEIEEENQVQDAS